MRQPFPSLDSRRGVVLGEHVYASPLGRCAGSWFDVCVSGLGQMGGSLRGRDRVKIDYQAVGSGVGIRQIKSRTVDFGASDAPLRPEELAAAGLMQFPIVVGGVVPVVNVEGIGPGQLRLTGSVLADIYLGKITKWNAEAIVDLNPGLALPNQAIIPIHRADGSGTTFVLADYLARVSAKWRDEIGVNTAVEFPTGIGGKGNEGVAGFTSRTKGAIGYVEHAYAIRSKLAYVSLKNREGEIRYARQTGVSVCRRKRRLGSRARVLCAACSPTRQADLADHRRNLCTYLQATAKAAHGNRDAEILRLVISRRRQIGR